MPHINLTNLIMENTSEFIKTGISKTYWNDLSISKSSFEPAKLCIGNDNPEEIAWLDELFRGGIKTFKDKPVTLLVKGPPGSGKTTFVLELCYKLATRDKEKLKSLYISIDSESKQIIRNAKDFGWENADDKNCIDVLEESSDNIPDISVWGSEKIEDWDRMSQVVDSAFLTLTNWFKIKLSKGLKNELGAAKLNSMADFNIDPHILVVDSLNIIPIEERGKAFQHFLKIAKANQNIKIVIFMLDGRTSSNLNPFWEYMSDIVVELNYVEYNDYYTGTIEIIKSRYQEHVWGKHQLKIYSKYTFPEQDKDFENKVLRSHPFRTEGGIFIFPSIHYYLSKYKRVAQKDDPEYDATYPRSLNNFLSNSFKEKELKGLPKGRCTAFIGSRGGHKSHIGYLHILSRLTKSYLHIDDAQAHDRSQESALIISLREDENNDIQREEIILKVERFAGGKKAGSRGLLELGNIFINKTSEDLNQINFIELEQNRNLYNLQKVERID